MLQEIDLDENNNNDENIALNRSCKAFFKSKFFF